MKRTLSLGLLVLLMTGVPEAWSQTRPGMLSD